MRGLVQGLGVALLGGEEMLLVVEHFVEDEVQELAVGY